MHLFCLRLLTDEFNSPDFLLCLTIGDDRPYAAMFEGKEDIDRIFPFEGGLVTEVTDNLAFVHA